MPSLFGLEWSPATATLNLLKAGKLNPAPLRMEFLKGLEKDLRKEVAKRTKKGKPITFELISKQVFKDKHYEALYKELGITDQLRAMISKAILNK